MAEIPVTGVQVSIVGKGCRSLSRIWAIRDDVQRSAKAVMGPIEARQWVAAAATTRHPLQILKTSRHCHTIHGMQTTRSWPQRRHGKAVAIYDAISVHSPPHD
jgi:hypothetical protein